MRTSTTWSRRCSATPSTDLRLLQPPGREKDETMTDHKPTSTAVRALSLLLVVNVALAVALSGCKRKQVAEGEGTATKQQSIQNIGSDTMVNLAQAWAEEYVKVDPGISVEVG